MATDGVEIIDGDSAVDYYSSVMDAYDDGANGNELRQMYEDNRQECLFSDFHYEICVTVYALALWDVGEITPEILQEVKAVIAKGACVADWTEDVDEEAGKARQKALDELWEKINKPNTNIYKREKYNKVTNLVFNFGDVLVFKLPDDTYGLTIVINIIQYRSECDYMLCRTTFNSAEKPTLENLSDLRILGSLVPSGRNGMDPEIVEKIQNLTKEKRNSGEIDQLMTNLFASMPKQKMPWVVMIQHEKLITKDYAQNFEKIGNIQLRCDNGNPRIAPDYKSFCDSFYIQDIDRIQSPHSPEMGEFTVDELIAQELQM